MSIRKSWVAGTLIIVGLSLGAAFVWKRFIHTAWEDEYAYTKGVQAVVYAFPYVLNSSVRWAWSLPQKAGEPVTAPTDAINHFFNSPGLTGAKYRDGGTPNNDTVYSTTWAYVDKEPLVISVPDIGTIPGTNKPRYYSFEIAGFDSDNFAYIGTRTTGNGAGNYAITPKGWKGRLPAHVQMLAESPTPWFLILGRTLVTGPEDFPAVAALMQQYDIRTLSDFENNVRRRPPAPPLTPVPHYKREKLALIQQFWNIANVALTENPPGPADARLMRFFSDIEVGPGGDLGRLSEDMMRGMDRAVLRGMTLLPEVNQSSFGTKRVNGWKYPPMSYGRAGVNGAWLTRASIQSLGGIVANDPEEAVYIVAHTDSSGELLNGNQRYRIRFAQGKLPPVNAFWSMSLYDSTNNLADNSIDRYSLGDRSPGLVFDNEGQLTLHISSERPQEDLISNWLPAPSGEFYLVLRAYLPGKEMIDQQWEPPTIVRQ